MPDLSALTSSERVLVAVAILAVAAGVFYAVGLVPWLLRQVFAFLGWLVETGFWLWERVLAGIPWPLLVLLIVGVHVVLYYDTGPVVTLLLGLGLLHVGFICCLAYIAIDQERLDVARGYKALHNPAKGQQLADRLTRYGHRAGLPLLVAATLACVSGFALFNWGLSETPLGHDWYAPGQHNRYRFLNADELAEARAENPPPGYPEFLVFSLLNLASAFDFIDVINVSGLGRVAYVHPNKWPVSVLLLAFRLFFTMVLLQQILSFFGKVRLIQESVRDFWSPHEPIQRRAGENLSQLGGRAVDTLLRSLELVEYVTPEQRDLMLRVITTVGPSTIPLLVDRLENPRTAGQAARLVREIALVGLGRLHALETLPRLVDYHRDENESLRLSLVEALEMVAEEGPADVRKRWRLQGSRSHRKAWWAKPVADVAIDPVALTVETLRVLLYDPVRAVRLAAIRLLGRLGADAREATPDLVRQTTDPEESVRAEAVRTLGDLGGPNEVAVPALVELLRNEQVDHVRVATIEALGRFGAAAAPAASLLTALVQDRDDDVRAAAAEALRRIGPLDGTVIPALVAGLTSPDNQVRIQAAEALGTIGPAAAEALPALVAALRDGNDTVRVEVARALGRLGESAVAALPALAQALRDADFNVAAEVAAALGAIGPAAGGALASLLKASRHPSPLVRTRVAEALAQVEAEPTSVLPCLVEMTHDEDDAVRAAALAGLSGKPGLEGPRREVFLAALEDESPDVRAVAVRELAGLGLPADERVERLLHAVDDVSDGVQVAAVEALAAEEPRPTVIDRLCRLLTEDSPALQVATLKALGRFGPRAAQVVPALLQILQRAGTAVRAEALHAASRIAPRETLSLFLGGLHDNDDAVRRRASAGLLACPSIPEEHIPTLTEALKDPDDHVRANVVAACVEKGLIRPEMYPLLAANLTEPDDALRLNALRGLQGAPLEFVEEMLPRLLADGNPQIRLLAAVRALQRDPDDADARRVVADLLRSFNDKERDLAEESLRELRDLGVLGSSEAG